MGFRGVFVVMNPPHPDLGTTLQTRPTLLFRVRDWQDGDSWDEFHRLYRRLIYGRARRAGLCHEDAEDVAQEVFKRVAETIRDFDLNPDRGSFRGWLMQLTRWRIADKFESHSPSAERVPHAPSDDGTERRTSTTDRIPAPAEDEDAWDREWREQLLATATERLARRVNPKHFQAFDLHVRQRWPVLKVAAQLGVNPASVYVISHRLTKRLAAEIALLEKQWA
ncbi:RNA polymerase subunit sigma [Opitutaceae bacterium EW11]|nr:RNA polymerase subunit sigma [Opitutaceae bacterium EW11]